MHRTAIIELEDGRLVKGAVQSAINHGIHGWEIELALASGDTFIWKQAMDRGQLLHLDA